MATEISTTTDISASPERVWAVLSDLSTWPSWHPAITAFTGTAAAGERLRFTARSPEGGGAFTLTPRVLAAEPARLLRWRGHFLVPGLFDATHEFMLEPTRGGTQVTQRERFSGALTKLLASTIRRTERDNARANAALRAITEARP